MHGSWDLSGTALPGAGACRGVKRQRPPVRTVQPGRSLDARWGSGDVVTATCRSELRLPTFEPDEAANVTGHLYGLLSAVIRWTVDEVEAIVRRRAAHLRSHYATRTLDELAVASPLGWDLS